jgi:flagellar protein FlgJ
MLRTTRRVLTGPLLVAAIGAGMIVAPPAAQAAGSSATVRVDGTLKLRSAPTMSSKIVGSVGDRARVRIDCVVHGQQVRGSVRTTTTWDRLTDGRYVSHAYVVATGALRRCAALPPQAVPVRAKPAPAKKPTVSSVVGRVRSADGTVNLRSAASTTAPSQGVLANGAAVALVCGVWGQSVAGTVRTTRQWNRTVSGAYISHAYVVTPELHLCKDAAPLPTNEPVASMTREQFIRAAVPGAQRGWREFGVPPSVTIAQAILESGWGSGSLAAVDRNFFGIKCFGGRYGTIASGCHLYNTTECTKAGSCYPTSATFRTYSTAADSFRDHGAFLRFRQDGSLNTRYQPAFSHTRDANTFIWHIWKAGYATDPKYYTKVTGLMSAHNLYQYDTWK